MSGAAPVSVVISSYDEGEAVAETVESVLAASVIPRDIVLVDDGSTDGSCERSWAAPVRVVRRAHAGIAAARNHGAMLATEDALVFLDAHCAVDDDWLEPLLHALARSPDALVGAAVRDARDPCFVGVGARLVNPLFEYRWIAASGRDEVEVGVVPGGCLAVQREAFAVVGGFGAFAGFGLEDVELTLRWWRSGRLLLGAPASTVTHQFRPHPPYPRDELAWLQNVLRTGLVHLEGAAHTLHHGLRAVPDIRVSDRLRPRGAVGRQARRASSHERSRDRCIPRALGAARIYSLSEKMATVRGACSRAALEQARSCWLVERDGADVRQVGGGGGVLVW